MINKSKLAKITSVVVGVMTSAMMLGGVAILPAFAATPAELQAQIDALMAQVKTLQGTAVAPAVATGYSFSANLKLGSKGADVMNLQKVLNSDADTVVALSGAGSPGMETSTFGPATKKAVIKFQAKHGIAQVGQVGPATRLKLNSLAVAAPVTPGVPGTPGTPGTIAPVVGAANLTISAPANIQPANVLAPMGAAKIPFTRLVLTASGADVVVNSVTVERVGPSDDAAFVGVDLLDENGLQIGVVKTLNSEHKAILGTPFTIKNGESKTVTVAATRSSSNLSKSGQEASFQVVAVDAGSAAIAGDVLPVKGARHTINESLTIGSVTTFVAGPMNPSAVSKEIGSSNYILSSIQFTAGSGEKVWLKSIKWNQSGTASKDDLANVKTYVDGVAYDTAISSDGKYYTSIFGNGILMDKGASKEIYVKGDIIGGSGRTVKFDLYRNTDLVVTGDTYGYSLVPPTAGSAGVFGSTNPWWVGPQASVSAGNLTLSKSASVAAQNIAINLANQPLGGFDVEVKGEAVSVSQMIFNLSASVGVGGGTNYTQDIIDVKLVDSTGKVVAGPVDINGTTVTFTDTVTFPVGKNVYTLKGKLTSDFGNNQTVAASTTPSFWTASGVVTGNSIVGAPSSAITGSSMTVKAASLVIAKGAEPVTQAVVSGAQGFVMLNTRLDASASGEDLKLTSLRASLAANAYSDLSGCAMWDGATQVSDTLSLSGTGIQNFIITSGSYVVPKETIRTLALKCNISGAANNTATWSIASSTVTGVTSAQSVTPTYTAGYAAGTITISGSGTFTVLKHSSSPSYTLVTAGTTGVTVGTLALRATSEPMELQKLAVQLTSGAYTDITRVALVDRTTGVTVGSTVLGGTTGYITLAAGSFIIPKDSDRLLDIKVDVAGISSNSAVAVSGTLVKVDYDGNAGTDSQARGTASGVAYNPTSVDTAVEGVRVVKSYPTVTLLSVPTNALTGDGTYKIMRFKVVAGSAGDVTLDQFSVTLATTTVQLANLNGYVFSDSGFSSAFSGTISGAAGKVMTAGLAVPTVGTKAIKFTTPLVISAGQTAYVEVRADVTNVPSGTGTSASVRTNLASDAVWSLAAEAAQAGANNFVWSPNSTTTSAVADYDWANGAGGTVLTIPEDSVTLSKN